MLVFELPSRLNLRFRARTPTKLSTVSPLRGSGTIVTFPDKEEIKSLLSGLGESANGRQTIFAPRKCDIFKIVAGQLSSSTCSCAHFLDAAAPPDLHMRSSRCSFNRPWCVDVCSLCCS